MKFVACPILVFLPEFTLAWQGSRPGSVDWWISPSKFPPVSEDVPENVATVHKMMAAIYPDDEWAGRATACTDRLE